MKKYFLPKAVGSGFVIIRSSNVVINTFVFVSKIYDSYKHALGEATIHLNVDIHESAGDLSPNEVDVQIQEDHIENGEDENYEGVSGKSSKY